MGSWARRFGRLEAGVTRALVRASVLTAVVVLGSLAMASVASAASFTVNDSSDAPLASSSGTSCVSTDSGGTCTLRAAVQAADNVGGASTITLPAGTFVLTVPSTGAGNASTGDLDVTDTGDNVALTVNGVGASSTVINANHIDRAFAVDAPGDSLSISGVTIENGAQPDTSPSDNSTAPGYGGAIYNDGSLTVTNSTLEGNEAYYDGGAIYSGSGATSTSISGSSTSGSEDLTEDAGGLFVDAGSMSISSSTFDSDTAPDAYAGALYDDSTGAGTITGSTFENDSSYYSGAIYQAGTGSLSITSSNISDDSTQGGYDDAFGGAVDTHAGTLSITSSTLDNDSGGGGGALYLDSTGAATLTNDTFANDASVYDYGGAIEDLGSATMTGDTFTGDTADDGAALYYDGTSQQLTNDTFDGNSGYYGAIVLVASGSTLTNDTIANNTGTEGGGIWDPAEATAIVNTIVADNHGVDCYDGVAGPTVDKGYNLDSDGTCFATGGTGSTPESTGDQPSVNPDLGALADNGGPTETDALLTGSPAIGKALASSCPATDQRGVPRPTACDIGAFQTAGADLGITAAAPASATVGSPVADTFTVTNHGPASATGVVVTAAVPAGSTYYTSGVSQGSCSGTTIVTCSLGKLDSSNTGSTTSATVTIVVIPSKTGTLAETAAVSSGTPDPNAANNAASGSTAVSGGPTVTVFTKPVVLTGVASQVTSSTAKLSAIVNPAALSTKYSIQYGTSKKYGKTAKGKTLAASTTPKGVVISVKGLKAGKTYHFRIVATNASGTSYGQDVTFKTKKAKKKPKKKAKK